MSQKNWNKILKELSTLLTDAKSQGAIKYLTQKIQEIESSQEVEFVEQYPLPPEIIGENDFALFSDGGCRGNPGPGSWGVVAQDSKGDILYESSGFDDMTTNNKMELTGAIKAIEIFLEDHKTQRARLFLYTDSKYVVDGLSSWMSNWKKRGWKKADGKVVSNLELWKRLDELKSKLFFFHPIWVKGHSGHPQNERCDLLCNIILDRELC